MAQVLDPQVSVTRMKAKGRTSLRGAAFAVPRFGSAHRRGSGWNALVDARGCKWTI